MARARDVESQEEDRESCAATYCAGRGRPAIAAALAPFVLAWNAIDAYLTPCLGAYARLGARAAAGSLCCCLMGYFRYEDEAWAGDAALGADCEFRGCDWVRVGDLSAGSEEKPMVLYQGVIEPRDCVQGQLGDCWLVSALACLAEHPGAIKRLILNGEKSIRGKYRVRFYDGKEKKWVIVTVDDLIPCHKGTKRSDIYATAQQRVLAFDRGEGDG